jgi:hypothetical protein
MVLAATEVRAGVTGGWGGGSRNVARIAFSEVADPVKSLGSSCSSVLSFAGRSRLGIREVQQPSLRARGGERCSPAHEWSRRVGGAIYVAGLVRRPRRSDALTHPSNLASPNGRIVVRTLLGSGYAAAAVRGTGVTRVGSYRVPSRSSA